MKSEIKRQKNQYRRKKHLFHQWHLNRRVHVKLINQIRSNKKSTNKTTTTNDDDDDDDDEPRKQRKKTKEEKKNVSKRS